MPNSKRFREGSELRHIIEDVTLNKAFQLAHSLYRYRETDRQVALDIVWEALKGVEVKLVAQHEADRHDPPKPTKVRWTTLQWFQILIYHKSEAYEKQQEANNRTSLTEEDMVIRYIKHLILTTCRRNSFHISLGLSRLLYDYNAAETVAIYDLVFQDPDSSTKKADAYYRGRKNKLIEELEKRFHQFVRIDQGPRGEKRFRSNEDSGRFNQLVIQYLKRFTPWETRCELPEHLDTWTPIHSLKFSQASQIHSVIHPSCFSRIIQALKLDPPQKRLVLPRFFHTRPPSDETTPPEDSSPGSELTEDEATEIRNRISAEARRRKDFVPRSLSVLADGEECARLDLAVSSRSRFDFASDVTLIELVGGSEEGELLLATHVLTHEEEAPRAEEYSIVLEGGQRISLVILLAPAGGDAAVSSVEIRYEETKALTAAAMWWRQFRRRLSEKDIFKSWENIPVLVPKLALAVVVLIGGGFILYLVLRGGSRQPQEIAKQQPTPAGFEEEKLPTPGSASSPQANATAGRTAPSIGKAEPSPSDRSQYGSTREQRLRGVTSLLNVERLYVESMGDDEFSRTVQQKLMEKLQAINRFVIAKDKNDADTAITGLIRLEGKRRESTGQEFEVGNVTLELVNISGDVVWRTRKFRGTADQIASQFTKDLLDAIRTERRHRKE